jgi:hypothetical protein
MPVILGDSVRSWDADWIQHYYYAVGFWNDNLRYAVYHDVGSPFLARVWVVRPNSDEEGIANEVAANAGSVFEPGPNCTTEDPDAWATVNFAKYVADYGHEHMAFQKVCVWGGSVPKATKGFNNQPWPGPWHYWWLTMVHELGHVLSLPHKLSGQCVMRDGGQMLFPCDSEWNWVNHHYGF